MSRSRKHTPCGGWTTSRSEKNDKRIANREFRRKARWAIKNKKEPPVDMDEVSDIWSFNKDGKAWYSASALTRYPHLMRK